MAKKNIWKFVGIGAVVGWAVTLVLSLNNDAYNFFFTPLYGLMPSNAIVPLVFTAVGALIGLAYAKYMK